VVEGTGIFYAKRAGHGEGIEKVMLSFKTSYYTA